MITMASGSASESDWAEEAQKKADEAIIKFLSHHNLPVSVMKSPYWEQMVAAVADAGEGFQPPTESELGGELLDDAIRDAKQQVEDQKKQWQKFGCTIILDWWTDGKNHTLLNFLVGSNGELIFLKSIDASSIINSAENLSLVLEEVVLECGVQNVVQVVTKNAAAYVVAGGLFQERHPTFFWTPCLSHSLDLLLEDIGKIDWVKSTVKEARDVQRYIYDNPWVLDLMDDHVKDEELVRSGFTRSLTNFLRVQSISRLLTPLKKMFVSQAWLGSTYSKNIDGERTAKIVFSDVFENRAIEIVKVTEPVMRVLCLVDKENNTLGYIYEAMRRAKEAIQNCYRGNAKRFAPILEIMDQRWNNQLHQAFYAAGYYLNPKFFFSDSFTDVDGKVMEGLTTCIEKMVPEVEVRDLIISELQNYKRASGKLFSSPLAIRGRTTQTPTSWWEDWGGNTPNLQKLALRILSQPCSASGCERNWSLFDAIHTKKLYNLTQERLNDLVFVKYNLRLHERKLMDHSEKVIDLDEIDPYRDWTMQDDDSFLSSWMRLITV